jgi:hypothetical protein
VSVRVLSKVWDGYPGGGSELLTLLALADWSDDEGNCFPSVRKIAEKVRLKERQAQRVVHSLIAGGFVHVTGNELGGAPGSSRRYRLNLSRLTGVSHVTPTGVAGDTPRRQTGVTEDGDGCHPRRETGVAHDTLTVSEPSEIRQVVEEQPSVSSKAADACPYEQIVNAYHEALPNNPRCKVISKSRKAAIKARWTEAAKLTSKPFGYNSREEGLTAWKQFFEICADSDFLTGRTQGTNGRPPFLADIDFLTSPSGFARTLENKYHREADCPPAAIVRPQDQIFRGCV